MLPLSTYREAIRLDEPLSTSVGDPYSNLDLLRVALGGLKDHRYPGIDPDLSTFPRKELAFALRHELVLRGPEPIDDEVTDAINLLLCRHSAHMGHMTAENLMRISDMIPASNYGSARNVATWRGDVRELAADAVVNAAMPNPLGCRDPLHPCIDNYIRGQDGLWIRNDCSVTRETQGKDQEVGDAVLTRGCRFPTRYVLHTLSPHLNGGEVTDEDREKFAACYTSCLDLVLEKGGIHSVSFCALSTGRNNFPFEETTHIALDTANQWLQYHGTDVIELVVSNIFEDVDAEGYMQAFESWVED